MGGSKKLRRPLLNLLLAAPFRSYPYGFEIIRNTKDVKAWIGKQMRREKEK